MERLTDPAQGYCEIYCPDGIAPGCDPEKCDHKADVAMYEALKCYEFSDAAVLNRAAQIIGTTVEHLLEEKFHNRLLGKTVYGIRVQIVRHIGRKIKKHDSFVVDEKILHQWTKDYYIADILLRMLTPRELYNAMGFPPDYIIDRDADGKVYKKSAQVARCGNAVCPPLATTMVRANMPEYCAVDINTMAELASVAAV